MATQQVHPMQVLHRGAKSDAARALQAATNRRLLRRGLATVAIEEDGLVGGKTMAAVTAAAWALGARRETIAKMDGGEIPIGVQRMIRNPGRRTDEQKALGKKRVAHMLAARKRRAAVAAQAGSARRRVVQVAQQAAANYRARPGAYHYLAGGRANTVCLEPTPSDWRSDCSQFVAAVYKEAGLPSPATASHEFAATSNIDPKGRVTTSPRPGDLGMYGVHGGATHHVELYCGAPGQEFIGHGSPPIDSATPGRPDYYLTFDFLG
jgi:cell wall-associated NlpC family hydrolase